VTNGITWKIFDGGKGRVFDRKDSKKKDVKANQRPRRRVKEERPSIGNWPDNQKNKQSEMKRGVNENSATRCVTA